MSTKVAFRNGDGLTTEEGASRGIGKLVLNGGVIGDSDLLPSQNGTPDNKVLVAVGDVLIGNNQPSSTLPSYFYHGWVTVAEQVTITSNSSGNPRIDAIVGYIDTTVNPSGLDDNPGVMKFAAVAGTPAVTPAAPDDTAIASAIGGSFPWVLVAHVAVANGFSSIVDANITDKRPRALILPRVLDDISTDFVASGLITAQTSGLIGAVSAGYAYVGGRMVFKPIVTKTFTASKDTYIDMPKTAKPTTTDDYTYTAVNNGNASPALAADFIRIAKVITNGSAITSVVTTGWDSLGNPIRNLNARVIALGYAQVVANQSGITTDVDLTGLTTTVLVPAGARVKITASAPLSNTSATGRSTVYIKEGATLLQNVSHPNENTSAIYNGFFVQVVVTPTAGSHTYKLSAECTVGTCEMGASATAPAFILVEII